jgi:hypothetical protein
MNTQNERTLDAKCEEYRPRADVSCPRKVVKTKKTEEPLDKMPTVEQKLNDWTKFPTIDPKLNTSTQNPTIRPPPPLKSI